MIYLSYLSSKITLTNNNNILNIREIMNEKDKQKDKKFKLPSSLRHLQDTHKQETNEFIKQLEEDPQVESIRKKHTSLFKLNPTSSAMVSELPLDLLRRKSRERMESLQDVKEKKEFNLMDHYKNRQDSLLKDRKEIAKKYNIDLTNRIVDKKQQEQKKEEKMEEQKEEKEAYDIVRPSQINQATSRKENSIFEPTIFQTPILPCFSSEFDNKVERGSSKRIEEGEGVWKVGKIKIKNGKCTITMGDFQFQGESVSSDGKAGVLSGNKIYQLLQWQNMWVTQPSDELFQ